MREQSKQFLFGIALSVIASCLWQVAPALAFIVFIMAISAFFDL